MMIRYNYIYLKLTYWDKEKAKSIYGWQWNPDIKMWSFPLNQKDRVKKTFPEFAQQIDEKLQDIWKRGQHMNNIEKENFKKVKVPEDYKFKLKPYAHQIEMLKHGLFYNCFGFLCEMGTGKTKVTIDLFTILYLAGQVKKCLVICPKTVIDNWEEEIEMNCDLLSQKITGTKKQRYEKLLTLETEYAIINYEGVLVLESYKELWKQFDMVVLDESSRIKSHQAKRSKLICKLFKNTYRKYILTGTPITQSPIDIYMQYRFLDENYLGFRSWYSFRNYYCKMGGYGNYQIIGYMNLPQLKGKIAKHSIQLKKEDCLDLPPKIYEKRKIEMTKELKEQYDSMRKDLILELEGQEAITAPMVLTKLIRLQQILSGVYLKEINLKLDELLEIINDNMGNGNQVIIWCRFINTIKLIVSHLKHPFSILYGDIENRQEQIKWFQDGDNKIFLGQLQTGGMGINLTAGNIVIYFENMFSLENRLQSEDRAHRIGQKSKVVYIDLIYKKTIDEQILRAIYKKQDVAKELVDSFIGGRYKV